VILKGEEGLWTDFYMKLSQSGISHQADKDLKIDLQLAALNAASRPGESGEYF